MVPSGRKWPDSLSVIAPSSQATTSVSSRPASSVSQGEAPSQPSQDGRLSARVVRMAVV